VIVTPEDRDFDSRQYDLGVSRQCLASKMAIRWTEFYVIELRPQNLCDECERRAKRVV
jgi:hypothetical protein